MIDILHWYITFNKTHRESFALWDINIFGSSWIDWIRGRSWRVYTSLCHHFSCFLACNRPIECFFQVSFFVQPFAFRFNWMIFDVVFPWRGYRFLKLHSKSQDYEFFKIFLKKVGLFTCALSEFCILFDIEVKQEVPKADSDGLLVFISVRIS